VGAEPLGETGLERVRAFFGIPLPDAQREGLAAFLAECAARGREFRWTPAANLHLTIRFLGQVEAALAGAIADRLDAAHLGGFDLKLGEVGAFKRGRLARVVWLGLSEGSDEIGALAETVEAECVQAGLPPEGHRYHAHLTMARARQREGAALPALASAPDLPGWRADEVVLYRSRLGRAGSVYEPLRHIRLG
jgi:2'-5' RNA ligase